MDCSLHMTFLHLHKHKKEKKYLFTLLMCSLIPRHFNCSVPLPAVFVLVLVKLCGCAVCGNWKMA
jgi:hypothetical protein